MVGHKLNLVAHPLNIQGTIVCQEEAVQTAMGLVCGDVAGEFLGFRMEVPPHVDKLQSNYGLLKSRHHAGFRTQPRRMPVEAAV